MQGDRPFTAIIPARAGSKGIPGKNLWSHKGVSLLERAITLAKSSLRIARVIVSTDSAEMRAIALRSGAECPSLRPAHLAGDTATSAAVVEHVLSESAVTSPNLLLLQVTSPLRTRADLEAFLDHYMSSKAPAAVSVVKHDEPRPEKLKRIENGKLVPYLGSHFEGPRQSLPQPYALNGAFYAIARDVFAAQKRFLPEGTVAFEMPASRSHNLDTPEDLAILEAMLAAGLWHMEDGLSV